MRPLALLLLAVTCQAKPNGLRLLRDQMPWPGGPELRKPGGLERGSSRAPLSDEAAGLTAVQLSSQRGREPARIDPGKAEDQYAERNNPQSQQIREEPEAPQGNEEEHRGETWNQFMWRWWDTFWKHFWSVLFSMILQLLLILLIAIIYRHKIMIHGELVYDSQLDDFSSSLFACHEDPAICFWSCCCPAIRWGDNIGKMQWMGFWQAFFFFLLMMILVQVFTLVGLSLFVWIAFAVLLAHYRGRLRRDLNFSQESAFCLDTLVYACCQCCAIAQEARHIKTVLKY